MGKSKQELIETIPRFSRETADLLGLDWEDAGQWGVWDEFVGAGYAQPSSQDFDAISLLARLEGIFLDPVYTGRAMRGMIELLGSGAIPGEGAVLFWHTGGLPTLFALDRDR